MNFTKTLAISACLVGFASTAGAATVMADAGNDCSGYYGQGMENCSYNGSPIIYKANVEGENETSPHFSSVSGGEFDYGYDDSASSGWWTYLMGDDDPYLTAVIAKAGNGFVIFDIGVDFGEAVNGLYSGTWSTEGLGASLSHLSFYDTGIPTVPLPATGLMLLGGIGAFGALRRRRKS